MIYALLFIVGLIVGAYVARRVVADETDSVIQDWIVAEGSLIDEREDYAILLASFEELERKHKPKKSTPRKKTPAPTPVKTQKTESKSARKRRKKRERQAATLLVNTGSTSAI